MVGSRSSRGGFSAVEAVVTLSIAMLLLSLSARAMGPVQSASAVRAAEEAFSGLLARARSQAIERGTTALLRVDAAADSAWVTLGGNQVERFDFNSSLDVDLQAPSGAVLCLTPRGVADPSCTSGSVTPVSFRRGGHTRIIHVLPLGQMIHP